MKPMILTILLALVSALPISAQERVDQTASLLKQLEPLVLPDNPTPQQTEAYVKEHIRVIQSMRHFPRERNLAKQLDLEKRFAAIPNRDIHLLFEQVAEYTSTQPIAARLIEKRDPKDYKDIVIAGLYDHPNNIIAIKQFGWYEDAKEQIHRKLEETKTMPPLAWWQAFTEVAEPKHFSKLTDIFLSEDFFVTDYQFYLEIVPGYDMAALVRKNIVAVERKIGEIERGERFGCRVRQRGYLRTQIAAGAKLGDVEMLGRVINALDNPDDPDNKERIWFYSSNRMDIRRHHVTRVIDFKGSNQEISAWYEANGANLAFDNFLKRFIILEDF